MSLIAGPFPPSFTGSFRRIVGFPPHHDGVFNGLRIVFFSLSDGLKSAFLIESHCRRVALPDLEKDFPDAEGGQPSLQFLEQRPADALSPLIPSHRNLGDIAFIGHHQNTGIAENIGVAFQIQDDILDVIGDSKELGKLTGSDEKDGKVTYVTMHGLQKASEDVRKMSEEALELYDSLTASNDFLRQLITDLITRTK